MIDIEKIRGGELKEGKFNKVVINVPRGLRYLGNWEEFSIPKIPHIMDKQIPGCGFTEYCITNLENTILCSPRKILLRNKFEQHPSDIFLVASETLEVDKDLDPKLPNPNTVNPLLLLKLGEPEEQKEVVISGFSDYNNFLVQLENLKSDAKVDTSIYNKIREAFVKYRLKMDTEGKPYKILVTYDSFRLVKEILCGDGFGDLFSTFQIVVDEFQSIFTDSKFKPDVEMRFLEELDGIEKVCYVSATPMIEEYLAFLDHFKGLDYYVLDWKALDPIRVVKPIIHVKASKSINVEARDIINRYLSGKYETTTRPDSNGNYVQIESKEAVFFVNSVKNIIQIIRGSKLKPEQVNILIADTSGNRTKLKKGLGSKYLIGRVPLMGETRKQFTFCTRTVYLGADFYSDNARSFVLSDANINTLSVDISLDLPQILGRQRLSENPWRNEAWFYYKPLTDETKEELTNETLDNKVLKKTEISDTMLKAFENYAESNDGKGMEMLLTYNNQANKINSYEISYVGSKKDPTLGTVLTFNNLVMLAEVRAFKIQQIDYADRFSVFSSINGIGRAINSPASVDDLTIIDFYNNHLRGNRRVSDKLKSLIDSGFTGDILERTLALLDEKTRKYWSLGIPALKACSCRTSELNKLLKNKTIIINHKDFDLEIGKKYLRSDIKKSIQDVYNNNGIKGTAKATDIEKWFGVRPCRINITKDGFNSKEHGFEILGIK